MGWGFLPKSAFKPNCTPQSGTHPFLQGSGFVGEQGSSTKTAAAGYVPEKGLVLAESIGGERALGTAPPQAPSPSLALPEEPA